MIRELVAHIASETTLTIGTDLFAGFFPQGSQDSAVAIFETGGQRDVRVDDRGTFRFMVRSRALSYDAARDLAYEVHDALFNTRFAVTLPEVDSGPAYKVNAFEPTQAPAWIGQDEKGRHEFSTNFIARYQIA